MARIFIHCVSLLTIAFIFLWVLFANTSKPWFILMITYYIVRQQSLVVKTRSGKCELHLCCIFFFPLLCSVTLRLFQPYQCRFYYFLNISDIKWKYQFITKFLCNIHFSFRTQCSINKLQTWGLSMFRKEWEQY